MLAGIPAVVMILSSVMNIERSNMFQFVGLILSILGVGTIISNADIQKFFL